MKRYLFLISLVASVVSCENDSPFQTERVYFENSELSSPTGDMGMYVQWEDGDKTAIRFTLTHPQDDAIADDELSEVFWIEVASGINEFTIDTNSDTETPGVEIFYVRACFCYFKAFTFEKAIVSGKKISGNTWEVSFDIHAKSEDLEYQLKDTGKYRPTNR